MKWLLALLITIISSTSFAHEITCSNYLMLRTTLEAKYGEYATHRGYGTTPESTTFLVEVWENRADTTFSIILVYPNGLACILVTGKELEWIKDAFDEPA